MPRKILITLGALILTLLFSLWIYLLLFASSEEGGIVTWFGGGTFDPTPITEVQTDTVNQLALPDNQLVQLTTKSVAGFGVVDLNQTTSTSTETQNVGDYRLRYAETGTGHIYEIDFTQSNETRISPVTVAKTVGAHFDKSGEAIVLTTEEGNDTLSSLYTLNPRLKEHTKLPLNSHDFWFIGDNILRYTAVSNDTTTAYELNWQEGTTDTLWNIPLTEIKVYWLDGGAIFMNKPSSSLKSGVYSINNSGIDQLIPPKLSLVAMVSDDGKSLWHSYYDAEGGWRSQILDLDSGATSTSQLPAIYEKCLFIDASNQMCAISPILLSIGRGDLDRWYRGEMLSSDQIWKGQGNEAVYVDSLSDRAGFDIDVDMIKMAPNNEVFFLNKTNRALWRYRSGL